MEEELTTDGEKKLRRQANVGLVVMGAIVALVIAAALFDGQYWFESREARIARLEQDEGSASLGLWYCQQQGGSCAKEQAEVDVARERLRDAYR